VSYKSTKTKKRGKNYIFLQETGFGGIAKKLLDSGACNNCDGGEKRKSKKEAKRGGEGFPKPDSGRCCGEGADG